MGVYRMLLTSKVKKISGVEVGVLEYGYKAGDEEPYWSGDDKLAKRCQLLENNAERRWDSKETPEYVVEYGYKEGRWVWKWWDGMVGWYDSDPTGEFLGILKKAGRSYYIEKMTKEEAVELERNLI